MKYWRQQITLSRISRTKLKTGTKNSRASLESLESDKATALNVTSGIIVISCYSIWYNFEYQVERLRAVTRSVEDEIWWYRSEFIQWSANIFYCIPFKFSYFAAKLLKENTFSERWVGKNDSLCIDIDWNRMLVFFSAEYDSSLSCAPSEPRASPCPFHTSLMSSSARWRDVTAAAAAS